MGGNDFLRPRQATSSHGSKKKTRRFSGLGFFGLRRADLAPRSAPCHSVRPGAWEKGTGPSSHLRGIRPSRSYRMLRFSQASFALLQRRRSPLPVQGAPCVKAVRVSSSQGEETCGGRRGPMRGVASRPSWVARRTSRPSLLLRGSPFLLHNATPRGVGQMGRGVRSSGQGRSTVSCPPITWQDRPRTRLYPDTWQTRVRLFGSTSAGRAEALWLLEPRHGHVERIRTPGRGDVASRSTFRRGQRRRLEEDQPTPTTEEQVSQSVYHSTRSTLEVAVQGDGSDGRTGGGTEGWWQWLVAVSPMILGIALVTFIFVVIFLAVLVILLSSEM